MTRPSLTTIALPHYELGRKAVEVLFAHIDRGPMAGDVKAEVHRVSTLTASSPAGRGAFKERVSFVCA
jgi:DNA-binding LacI/PurR family transcriptional regulator